MKAENPIKIKLKKKKRERLNFIWLILSNQFFLAECMTLTAILKQRQLSKMDWGQGK
jgi:hypothetical protein